MKIAFRLVMFAALLAAGFWLWTVLFPSPEKLVLKKISGLAQTLTFGADASNLIRAGRVSSLIGYFTADAQVVVDVAGFGSGTLNGSDEIRETAARGFAGLKSLTVKFLDATPKVAPDRQTTEVNCTAEIHVNSGKDFGVQELRFQFRHADGEWRIARVETVKTLQ